MIKLKRRIGSAFLACMMLLSLLPVTALATSSGNNLIGISTVEDLSMINENGHYVLLNDIDASTFTATIPQFSGSLDGNGHKISGLSCPLFGVVKDATVENLTLSDVNIIGEVNIGTNDDIKVGALAQEIAYSTIGNVIVEGKLDIIVDGTHLVGGLCGFSSRSNFSNCSFNGMLQVAPKENVTDIESYVGGIAGSTWIQDNPGEYSKCVTSGTLVSTGSAKAFLGGITGSFTVVGWNLGSITGCSTEMKISGSATNEMKAGGMSARADYQAKITECASSPTIDVTGVNDCLAGGIIGYGELNASIDNCYVYDGSFSAKVTANEKQSYAGSIAAFTWGSGNGIIYINNCVAQDN